MHWLQSLDTALFHFINGTLSNPFFDWLMPVLSGADATMRYFIVALLIGAVWVMVKGGARARICLLFLVLVVAIGDGLIINSIKHAVGRPRPCLGLSEVVARLGCSTSGSMPSAHSANWFACAMVMFVFYRRSAWFLFPMAAAVAFSRVYCGVHYPSDITVGAILGAGYAVAIMVSAQLLWRSIGKKFFPNWHAQLPSLLQLETKSPPNTSQPETGNRKPETDWLNLGYLVIVLALIGRWLYISSGFIGLSQDEAYQWLWSKHLALSYFSKPPGIAYIQWAGTSLFGDTNLGVRFFSPLFGAILSWLILNFLAREIGARRAFLLLMLTFATPLLVVGSVLMTIDPPLVLCWMWGVIVGWRAVQTDGKTRDWLLFGLATGLGFLCKYSALFAPVCLLFYFALQPSARIHLRRSGFWLSLGIIALCTLPVLIWNSQNGWITVHHVADNAGLDKVWKPTLKYFVEFSGSQLGLLNPIFFVGMIWACFAFWKTRKEKPLQLFLFCMGGPVFFGYWLYAFHSRVLPNWIAPAIPPLFCLMALFWAERRVNLKPWLAVGLTLGLVVAAVMYDSDLLGKVINKLPGDKDPSHRVRGWRETALLVEQERTQFDTNSFIITEHYGTTGLYSFYSKPARAAAIAHQPIVYCIDADAPVNQIHFWEEYNYRKHRQGQNAIFVKRLEPYKLESGWMGKWLKHQPVAVVQPATERDAPDRIIAQFQTVTNLGVREITFKDGRVFQRVQIFGCYGLK